MVSKNLKNIENPQNTTRASPNIWQHSDGVFWGNTLRYVGYLNFKGPLPHPPQPGASPLSTLYHK
ncbi:hypothetical protein E2C01_063747 [Portunus trituberculatus]|uniref:Uncharacterized protein n=1 Tax=Portunus trituberculatus TaxID=210409 RepID=A0A5B7H9Z5_PORTR|nr:hypothetical protein [Portunus trituberculatus]